MGLSGLDRTRTFFLKETGDFRETRFLAFSLEGRHYGGWMPGPNCYSSTI